MEFDAKQLRTWTCDAGADDRTDMCNEYSCSRAPDVLAFDRYRCLVCRYQCFLHALGAYLDRWQRCDLRWLRAGYCLGGEPTGEQRNGAAD